MKNSGTIQGNGSCSASAPPESACKTCSASGTGCIFNPTSASVLQGASVTLNWSCPSDTYTSSQGVGFSTNNQLSGSVSVSPSQDTTYTLRCNSASQTAQGTSVITILHPDLSITAAKDRVRKGDTDAITWHADNVTAGSCRVSSNTLPDVWGGESGTQNPTINSQTTFTLACSVPLGPLSQSVTVSLIPSFQEQ